MVRPSPALDACASRVLRGSRHPHAPRRARSYRRLYTIEWDVAYRMYYQTTICVAEMFGAICVMMLAVIRFPQPWAYNQAPPRVSPKMKPRYTVHCCVPCYNEPSDIVFATCEAALNLKHEWAKVYVYMLDDGRNMEREKQVMLMNNERLIYLARNKWPGVPIHGKAGNINSALKVCACASVCMRVCVRACMRVHVCVHERRSDGVHARATLPRSSSSSRRRRHATTTLSSFSMRT